DLPNLWVHRAGVDAFVRLWCGHVARGTRRRCVVEITGMHRVPFRRGSRGFRSLKTIDERCGIAMEFVEAVLAAKVVGVALVLFGPLCRCRVYGHAAYWIGRH